MTSKDIKGWLKRWLNKEKEKKLLMQEAKKLK